MCVFFFLQFHPKSEIACLFYQKKMYLCYFLSPEVISAVYMLLIKWMRLRKRSSDISRANRFSIIFISFSISLVFVSISLGLSNTFKCLFYKISYLFALFFIFFCCIFCLIWFFVVTLEMKIYIIPIQNRIASHSITSNRSKTKRHSLFMKWLDNDDRQKFSKPIFIGRAAFILR